jgi:predicted secreted hydrolase
MTKRLGLFLSAWLALACASNPFPLSAFDPAVHGSAAAEWAPHDHALEWWYVTGIVADGAGDSYFFQFTIFHGYRLGALEGFVLHLALTDVTNGKHFFFEDSSPPGDRVFGRADAIVFKNSAIAMRAKDGTIERLSLTGTGREFSFALDAAPAKPAVWHGENGIIAMGAADRPEERSFYCSFTNLKLEGTLAISGRSGPVTGSGWFDRQWGRFTEYGWDWFSLRLFDGREFMLFGFPKTGLNAGTLVRADGNAVAVASFAYEKTGTMRYAPPGGRSYALGWRLRLPAGEVYDIHPVLADQFNPSQETPPYWEGLCEVSSSAGEKIGYCVVETTDGAQ